MEGTSKSEFDSFPGRRDGPNHADRLGRASRVLSARTPRQSDQMRFTAYRIEGAVFACSDQSYQKTQCTDQPQLNCNLPLQIHRNRETTRTAHKDFDVVSIFRQRIERNAKLTTASESTEPFKPSLTTAIEMNETKCRPIDSCINTLRPSTWRHEEQWKIERPNSRLPSSASQNVQARNKQTNCQNTEMNTLCRQRKTKRGTQPHSAPNYATRALLLHIKYYAYFAYYFE